MTAQTAPGGTATLGGRTVARIGFGAMQLERAGREAAVAVLRRAVELGVDHIDTAEFYGAGSCNRLIREALYPYPDGLALVSKVGAEHVPGAGLVAAQRPEQLRSSVEANLASLGVERLDVVNVRRADGPPGLVVEGDQRVDLETQLAELTTLRDEGKIAAIGLSNITAPQLIQSLPAGIACVQNAYSLVDRVSEPVLTVCRAHEIPWVPFFPLGSAFPNRPKVTDHPAVITAATSVGATPAQIALAWLLAIYPHTLPIPGTSNPVHLDQNLAAGEIHLPAEIITTLNAIT